MIPLVDNQGNKLVDIAQIAHRLLFQSGITEGSFRTPGQTGFWRDDAPEPHDTLTAITEDTPEHDSAFKQVAAHIAQISNQWGLFCYKEGKNGIQKWQVNNPDYREGEGADPSAIDPQAQSAQSRT